MLKRRLDSRNTLKLVGTHVWEIIQADNNEMYFPIIILLLLKTEMENGRQNTDILFI